MFNSPNSVAAEKGMQNRADKLILARRKDEHIKMQMMAQKTYYQRANLLSQFEKSAQKMFQRKQSERKMNEYRKEDEISLEKRREKLRQLFNKDIELWREELKKMEPSKDTKLQELRNRVSELQKKHEDERQKVVQEKLLEQKRRNCDELRKIRSKCMIKQVDEVLKTQVTEMNERKQREIEENRYYDELWENERLKKVAREESENFRKMNSSKITSQENQQQIQLLKAAKKKEEELKLNEAACMRQILELQTFADEHNARIKEEEQRKLQRELDQVNKAKIEERQKEIQKDLEADLQWIQGLMEQEALEQEGRQIKKDELRNELLSFHNLILQHKNNEIERKKKLESFYLQEEHRVWNLKMEQWNKECNQRAKLMQEVIKVRESQLAQKLEAAREELEAKKKERERLEQWMTEEAEKEKKRREKYLNEKKSYHDILCSQILENQLKVKREKEQNQKEYEEQLEDTKAYQQWFENELQHLNLNK